MRPVLALFTLALAPMVPAQWQLSSYMPAEATNICAVNADTVVITDYSGSLVRTFDGGESWTAFQTPFVNSWFLAVDFPSASVGYACGGTAFGEHKNCIVKSVDGGLTWDSLTANAYPGFEFTDIEFVDENIGFVAGDPYSGLRKTTDGGHLFVPVGEDLLPPAFVIEFVDELTGFVSTAYYQGNTAIYGIYRTEDQGDNWVAVYIDTMENVTGLSHRRINTIQFADAQHGFAAGGNGTFLQTIDGGLSWSASTMPPGTDLTALWFTSPLIGYINSAGTISRTVDGGATWTIQSVVPVAAAQKLVMVNGTLGYALAGGDVYKTENAGGANAIGELEAGAALAVYPSPVSERLFIRSGAGMALRQLEVVNAAGEMGLSFSRNLDQIDVRLLPAGVYTLRATGRAGIACARFVVLH